MEHGSQRLEGSMTSSGQRAASSPPPGGGAPPKRKLRNFLLDARFQLKYTGMVVGVAVLISVVLGYFAIQFSRETSDTIHACNLQTYADQPDVLRFVEEESRKFDQKVMYSIVGGLGALVIVLALTGIVVTHKVVGPAYKLRRMMREVGDGNLSVEGRLRKGDELQTVFDGFEYMLHHLQSTQSQEIEKLDEALARLESDDVPGARTALTDLRDAMQRSLGQKQSS